MQHRLPARLQKGEITMTDSDDEETLAIILGIILGGAL